MSEADKGPSAYIESSTRVYGRNPLDLPLWRLHRPWQRPPPPCRQDQAQTFCPAVFERHPLLQVSIRGCPLDETRRRRRAMINRLSGLLPGKRKRRRGCSRCVGIEREFGRLQSGRRRRWRIRLIFLWGNCIPRYTICTTVCYDHLMARLYLGLLEGSVDRSRGFVGVRQNFGRERVKNDFDIRRR